MAAINEPIIVGPQPHHRARRLRVIGAIVLALGLSVGDGVYWLGTRNASGDNPLPVIGEDKGVTRQAETLFGQQSVFASQIGQALRNPLTQAGVVLGVAVVLAGCCFYAAGVADRNDQSDDGA
jgi:hypothetical protein